MQAQITFEQKVNDEFTNIHMSITHLQTSITHKEHWQHSFKQIRLIGVELE
jgi:hypothetical protein